ncbi:MAG: hypothetical protein QNK04_03280 [Myxococcota bacterium]|nr:hypothetical protein [Myxococcota bacterium]
MAEKTHKEIRGVRIQPDSTQVGQVAGAPIFFHGRVSEDCSDFWYIFRCMVPVFDGLLVADEFSGGLDESGNRVEQRPLLEARYGRHLAACDEQHQLMLLRGSGFMSWGRSRDFCQGAFLPVFDEAPSSDTLHQLFRGSDAEIRSGAWPDPMRALIHMWDDIYWEYYSREPSDIDRLLLAHQDDRNLTLHGVDIREDYPNPRDVELPAARLAPGAKVRGAPLYRTQRLELTDDFEDVSGWVGLCTGDIYRGEDPFGSYLAYWRPNLEEAAWLVVQVVDHRLEVAASIGVELAAGDELQVRLAEESELPWGADHFEEYVGPADVPASSTAAEAFALVEDIVKNDPALCKYLLDPAVCVQP